MSDPILKRIFNLVYPVGSIYMSVNNVNPENLFGGTWVAWGSGRVPVGVNESDTNFNLVEKTGGSNTHNHSIIIGQATWYGVPLEESEYGIYTKDASGNRSKSSGTIRLSSGSRQRNTALNAAMTTFTHDGFAVETTGVTHNASTLQPYITCYMWKRTA